METHTFLAIDLKSFYASVECRERGLDPLDTNLVVADESRTDKTICLAVTPALKSYGVPGRARLFEVRQRVRELNNTRRRNAPGRKLTGSSHFYSELQKDNTMEASFLIAPPRMALYMEYSQRIYGIYLKYFAPEDMVVYSVDEVFMDATNYIAMYNISAEELCRRIILDVLSQTGITATAGIGTNLFLCKIAMDVMAKHIPADENGVRVARLDEQSFRANMWGHTPITDFWRVGKGYARKLAKYGMLTLGDVARCSIENEDLLYKLFGKNTELLIDHAWGWEPCTIADIRAYRPASKSISSGQVLQCPYSNAKALIVIKEMADWLSLDLVSKGLVTDQIVLTVGYDIENLTDQNIRNSYHGEVVVDRYGRSIPQHGHGSENLGQYTASTRLITEATERLFKRITDNKLLIRRMYIVANNVLPLEEAPSTKQGKLEQLDLFTDYTSQKKQEAEERERLAKEHKLQLATIAIKQKFGKNALLRGMNLQEGATSISRNQQIGGHKA